MVKIKVILAIFFAFLVGVLSFWIYLQGKQIKSLKDAKNTLEMNNNMLITRLEREHNDKLEISRKNQELESLAKRSVGFDWTRDISNDELVLWLHKNAVQVQRDRARTD